MPGKRVRFLTMMAAAVGIPYAWFNENFATPLKDGWKSLRSEFSSSYTAGASEGGTGDWSGWPGTLVPQANPDRPAAGSQPAASHQLADVLRFDVGPRWIAERWGRVSTVRAEQDLEGLRVPLVTGTNLHDVAGSLTYYFDREQRVRRLTLRGHTGDERPLVDMAMQRFGLKAEPSLAAVMLVTRWNGKPVNVLRVTHAPIMRANTPNTRLLVEMELNDPASGHGLSRELSQTLQNDSHVRRWGG